MKKTRLARLSPDQIITLKRNPQYLTPKQMDSLKASIKRDGFCAPILVRPKGSKYEVISGNHRFMAACELGIKRIPVVIANLSDKSAQRLAINLNTIHGEPNAEILAPFLAELDENVLREIHIDDDMKENLMNFDAELAEMIKNLNPPKALNRDSPTHKNHVCKCPNCGSKHFKK